ncbi:MAG: TIGR01777 family protein [Bacteroidetes bacterium]|nr:TIGR01777 family protein [Bacteroidota bacterium]
MRHKILITGASGLVGTHLSQLLLQKGYEVVQLGRSKKSGNIPSFVWNVEKQEIDTQALEGVDTIVHLAGAGIADKRWNEARKKEILESRTHSTRLLFNTLKQTTHQVKNFISASAIGYYGFEETNAVFTEESNAGKDYLAHVTKQWEAEADQMTTLGIRLVKIRIGIVLSEKGGALAEMAKPVQWGVGSPLGSGKQCLSWIHIDDLCALFAKAIEDTHWQGAYNGVGKTWATNAELTKVIAKVLHRPLWLPPVPAFVLKIILGEMASLVVTGSKVSNEKVERSGFTYAYTDLEKAVANLLGNK